MLGDLRDLLEVDMSLVNVKHLGFARLRIRLRSVRTFRILSIFLSLDKFTLSASVVARTCVLPPLLPGVVPLFLWAPPPTEKYANPQVGLLKIKKIGKG